MFSPSDFFLCVKIQVLFCSFNHSDTLCHISVAYLLNYLIHNCKHFLCRRKSLKFQRNWYQYPSFHTTVTVLTEIKLYHPKAELVWVYLGFFHTSFSKDFGFPYRRHVVNVDLLVCTYTCTQLQSLKSPKIFLLKMHQKTQECFCLSDCDR